MKFILSNKGTTLVEALVSLAMVGVIAYGFMATSSNMNQSSNQQKQIDQVEDLILRNVSRLRSANSESFPPYGENLLREYYLNGTLINEQTVSSCEGIPTRSGAVSVCIRHRPVLDGDVTFERSDFMKLPQFGQKLYKLDISGETMAAGKKIFRRIIVFKR